MLRLLVFIFRRTLERIEYEQIPHRLILLDSTLIASFY